MSNYFLSSYFISASCSAVHVLGDSLVFFRHDLDFVPFGHAFIRQPLRPRPTVAAFWPQNSVFASTVNVLSFPLTVMVVGVSGGKESPKQKVSVCLTSTFLGVSLERQAVLELTKRTAPDTKKCSRPRCFFLMS